MSRELKEWEQPYPSTEHCDECNKTREGTCHPLGGHIFICSYCANPPLLVGLYRKAKRKVAFYARRARYYATTTAAERAERRAHFERKKAEINARRAARGKAPIGGGA